MTLSLSFLTTSGRCISVVNNALRFAKTIYDPQAYFKRCIKWVENWNDSYVIPGKKGSIPSNYYFVRLLRSFLLQGVFSSYNYLYWKYIINCLIKFKFNLNKIALSLYLAYFFRVAHDITGKIETFVESLPSDLVDEWQNYFNSNKMD